MAKPPSSLTQPPHHTFGNVLAVAMAAFGAAYLAGTATHAAEAVDGIDAKAMLVLKRLVCIALEDTEANPRRKGRKGRKLAEAARLARRSAPPEPWGSAALGGQP